MLLSMFPAVESGVCFRHPYLGGNSMLHRLILALVLVGFIGAVTLPSYTTAQTTTEEKKDTKKAKTTKDKKDDTKKAEKKEKKKLTPAQQKFSNCAKTWGDHKKATGEKTRKQYNAYMKTCLKKET
jgi:hypothetical protein